MLSNSWHQNIKYKHITADINGRSCVSILKPFCNFKNNLQIVCMLWFITVVFTRTARLLSNPYLLTFVNFGPVHIVSLKGHWSVETFLPYPMIYYNVCVFSIYKVSLSFDMLFTMHPLYCWYCVNEFMDVFLTGCVLVRCTLWIECQYRFW